MLAAAFGLLAACGSDGVAVTAEVETSEGGVGDAEAIDDGGEPIPIDLEALGSSTWTLRFGGGPDGEVPVIEGWPITITFDDGTFGGTAACNGYGGTYDIDGSGIRLADIGQNLMGCEPDVEASEVAFFSALRDVDGINLIGNELALSGMSTELIFAPTEPAPLDALVDQLWVLEALLFDGEETPAIGEPATLLIDSNGSFTGSTGCRTLAGRYLLAGNSVVFNEMAADGECPTSMFDQDRFVINVLGDGFTAAVQGETLTVESVGNQRLRYRAASEVELADLNASPAVSDAHLLDGTNWVFIGGDSPDGPIADPRTVDPAVSITLTFTIASYEGIVICNDYGGEAGIGDSLWNFTLGSPSAEEEGCYDELDGIPEAYLDALPHMNEGGIENDGQSLVMNGNDIELHFERAD